MSDFLRLIQRNTHDFEIAVVLRLWHCPVSLPAAACIDCIFAKMPFLAHVGKANEQKLQRICA